MKNLFAKILSNIKQRTKLTRFELPEVYNSDTDISKWSVTDINCTREMFSDDVVIAACDEFEKITRASRKM